VRVVYWNIRAGGGRRAEAIARQLARWRPDVVGLCEFRATAPSAAIADVLAAHGLAHRLRALDRERPATNGLLLASRRPLRRVRTRAMPSDPTRWLLARIEDGPCVGVVL